MSSLILAACAGVALLICGQVGAQVVISEFMANNSSTLTNSLGETSDWIELHNGSTNTVDLDGWYLSDDSDDLTKCRLLSTNIAAGGFAVLFADGDGTRIENGEMFVDFKLSAGGEFLALVKPDGVTIASSFSPEYPPQVADVSFGISFHGASTSLVYHVVPSPGWAGGPGEPTLGALISQAAYAPAEPVDVDSVTVTAVVESALAALASVQLHYRRMFDAEVTLQMWDDGTHGDGAADDGVFGATIPAGAAGPREMLRWYITAEDIEGAVSRWPVFAPGARTAEYLGTVIRDPLISSRLPLFTYFIEDTDWYIVPDSRLYDKNYANASLSYLGRFYDNVRVKIRGSSAIVHRFPKQSLHFDFCSNNRFYLNDAFELLDEINITELWTDKAYVRNRLSMMSVYKAAGVAYSEVSFFLTYFNGEFNSVASFTEEPDTQYLERHGLHPDGAFYKMQCPLTSSAVFPDFFPGMNPNAYDGAEKRTRLHENHDDLEAIVSGTAPGAPGRNAFLYDNFDVPQIINYMAASVLIQDWDRWPKNHFMYRDTEGTGLWQMHPWDADQSWGLERWFTDTITTSHPTMSHPLHGESSYPNVYGQTHRLVDAFHDQPLLREMFLRRLRSLMDEILQPPGTDAGELVLENEIERLYDEMHVDVDADKAKWGMPFGASQNLRQALDALVDSYIVPRRNKLYDPANYGGIIPGSQPAAPVLAFGTVLANPPSGNQGEEYLVLTNSNAYAVDLSGWTIDGGIRFEFAPGTVITALGSAWLSPDIPAFRARSSSPRGGEGLLVLGEYDGQLSARGETLVLLRPDGSLAASLTYAGNPSAVQQDLRVGELHFSPRGPTAAELGALPGIAASEFEFLELVNIGTTNLVLSESHFVDGISFTFPPGTSLPAGDRLVVAANPAAFALRHPPPTPAPLGPWTGALDNDGEVIELLDAANDIILEFSYKDARGWPLAADGAGHSLVPRVMDGQASGSLDYGGNWRASAFIDGSPGEADPDPVVDVVINEFAAHTDTGMPPPDDSDDWIELHSVSNMTLTDWYLSDDDTDLKKWRIPSGTAITAGGRLTFHESTGFHSNRVDGFGLNKAGERLFLSYLPGTAQDRVADCVRFEGQENGASWGRYPDGGPFCFPMTPTPAASNRLAAVEPVISQIMYHPYSVGTTEDEYVVIQNDTGHAVELWNDAGAWRLSGVGYSFPSNTVMGAGEALTIVPFDPTDAVTVSNFLAAHNLLGTLPALLGPCDGTLSDTGERLALERPQAPDVEGGSVSWVTVDEVIYASAAPWPDASANGAALHRIDLRHSGNDPLNWTARPTRERRYGTVMYGR